MQLDGMGAEWGGGGGSSSSRCFAPLSLSGENHVVHDVRHTVAGHNVLGLNPRPL